MSRCAQNIKGNADTPIWTRSYEGVGDDGQSGRMRTLVKVFTELNGQMSSILNAVSKWEGG